MGVQRGLQCVPEVSVLFLAGFHSVDRRPVHLLETLCESDFGVLSHPSGQGIRSDCAPVGDYSNRAAAHNSVPAQT